MDDAAKERFIENISGHMSTCRKEDIIKRQIAIFREVSSDLAARLEKATGVKGHASIADLTFNGTHNGFAKEESKKHANGMKPAPHVGDSIVKSNGAPAAGTHNFEVLAH